MSDRPRRPARPTVDSEQVNLDLLNLDRTFQASFRAHEVDGIERRLYVKFKAGRIFLERLVVETLAT
jgi:hypothetical protein